jgi:spore photoproduct lyase
MRYFKPLRIQLYQEMVERIRGYAPELTVYLCMEDDEVWDRSFGCVPSDLGGLPALLDRSAAAICGVSSGGKGGRKR